MLPWKRKHIQNHQFFDAMLIFRGVYKREKHTQLMGQMLGSLVVKQKDNIR